MSSTSGYPSTVILEANRRASEEFKSGNFTNPSLFTNKVNDGFRVNTGDIISVHSAYISELGAEGSEIEIKGIALNASKSVDITTTTHQSNTSFTSDIFRADQQLINGNLLNSLVTASHTINFRDDSINMVVSPYKNVNGEFYTTLPWNYAVLSDRTVVQDADAWTTPQPSIEPTPNGTGRFGSTFTGNTTLIPHAKTWNRTDKRKFYPGSGLGSSASATVSVRNDNSRYAIFQNKDVIHTYGLAADDVATSITDALKGIKWGEDEQGNSISISNTSYVLGDRQDRPVHGIFREICLHPYTRVRTLLSASANLGYNSPTDVASKITEDLLRTVDIKKKILINTNVSAANGSLVTKETVISTSAENQVNKLYKCAGPWSFSSNNASRYHNWDSGGASYNDRILEYIAAYETIGVKRPDLFEYGREIMPSQGYVLQSAYERDSSTKLLQTSIPWTSENLKNLSDLITMEQRYPELLDSDNLNGEDFPDLRGSSTSNFSIDDNLWFLHLNMSASNCSTLGYDLGDTRASYWSGSFAGQANQGTLQPSASMSTAPIFLSFNPETREKDENQVSGFNFDSAVYGFAVKHTTPDFEDFISVKVFGVYKTTDTSRFWQSPDPVQLDNIPKLTRIGWDYHFTAYGCPCIILYNGMNGEKGTGYERQGLALGSQTEEVPSTKLEFITLGDKIPEIYLGSPNITLSFSEDVDRFEWRNFHTSEVIGNLYNAGYKAENLQTAKNASAEVVFTNPDATPIPANPNADTRVYKINKQLLKNNWTPLMSSYVNENEGNFLTRYDAAASPPNASYTARQSFPFLNEALPSNSIYDSNCGLFVLDWGVDEKSWNNSLWGIMGFQYQQTEGVAGNQTRVINSNNWSEMLENTTNADITNTDFDQLTRNMFGVATYNLHPPVQQMPYFSPELTGNASHRYYPTISIPQDTGQPLRALNIPTRTLRPYYTIRSNIINGKSSYFGGSGTGVALPVVAVVDKVSNSGDFFNIDNNDLTFTATQAYTLSDITTSICDPDGSYSKLSENSAVLYKIQRQVKADTNVVENILQGYEKKKRELLAFEAQVNAPTPTKADIKSVILQMLE